jgi:hypothetical protein
MDLDGRKLPFKNICIKVIVQEDEFLKIHEKE